MTTTAIQPDPTTEEPQLSEKMLRQIARELGKGRDPETIVSAMREKGWGEDDARQIVELIEAQLTRTRSRSSGTNPAVVQLLTYIGILALINFLSLVFDWPFWVY